MAPALNGAVVLIGFMGAGKSTAAPLLAAELGVPAHDTDELLAQRLGMTIEDYFEHHGEADFRAREEELALELLDGGEPRVVALGGGTLASERVRAALAAHTAVLLDVDPADAWKRAAGSGRPLARDERAFAELHAARRPVYAAAARAIVPADDPRRAIEALPALAALERAPAGTRLLWAASASGSYPVYVGRGLIAAGFDPLPGAPRFVVTDETVGALLPAAFDPAAGRLAIPAGEQSKTIATAEQVLRELARAEITRSDAIVALGGGVVGDLAGFCAASYQRGIAVVQVPTTLVAMVDSAYGGKTGVDLPEGKNYVGAYHQPAAVVVDPAVLETLPAEELAAGYAEVVKTALLAGGDLWERVRGGADPSDDEVILACARYKLGVVARDERDAGLRQVLNLGHTVGHAIETATGYARYRHGEAVALGLLAALRLSGQDQLRAEVAALLATRGLPQRLEGVSAEDVARATRADKKRVGEGDTPFVLLDAPGVPRPGARVGADELLEAVRELTR